MDKDELMRTITSAHRELEELVDCISDGRLRDPAMDDWDGKDVRAHLAWWHDHTVLVIEGLRAGRQPYDGTDPANTNDGVNERVHREHVDDSARRHAGRVQAIVRAGPGFDQPPDQRQPVPRASVAVAGWRAAGGDSCGTPRVTTRHTSST